MSAANAALSGEIDPDLVRIIAAWPELSQDKRDAIRGIIDAE